MAKRYSLVGFSLHRHPGTRNRREISSALQLPISRPGPCQPCFPLGASGQHWSCGLATVLQKAWTGNSEAALLPPAKSSVYPVGTFQMPTVHRALCATREAGFLPSRGFSHVSN